MSSILLVSVITSLAARFKARSHFCKNVATRHLQSSLKCFGSFLRFCTSSINHSKTEHLASSVIECIYELLEKLLNDLRFN